MFHIYKQLIKNCTVHEKKFYFRKKMGRRQLTHYPSTIFCNMWLKEIIKKLKMLPNEQEEACLNPRIFFHLKYSVMFVFHFSFTIFIFILVSCFIIVYTGDKSFTTYRNGWASKDRPWFSRTCVIFIPTLFKFYRFTPIPNNHLMQDAFYFRW